MQVTICRQVLGQVKSEDWTAKGWTVENGVFRVWDEMRTLIIPLSSLESVVVESPSTERVTTKRVTP